MALSGVVVSIEVDYENFKSFVPEGSEVIRCKAKPFSFETPINIVADEEDLGMPLADISMLNIGSFVITQDLYEQLKEPAQDTCQFIPLQWTGIRLWLVNVLSVADCLDKENSEFNSFGGVNSVVFNSSKVPIEGFFKVAEDNYTGIFVSPNMYKVMNSYKPTGVGLKSF
jgi:hypothetical protein